MPIVVFNHFQILKKDEVIEWPGTLAIVHSYISYKAGNRFPGVLVADLPTFMHFTLGGIIQKYTERAVIVLPHQIKTEPVDTGIWND